MSQVLKQNLQCLNNIDNLNLPAIENAEIAPAAAPAAAAPPPDKVANSRKKIWNKICTNNEAGTQPHHMHS